ncbi:hemolysin III family protein [Candidatus Nomurabacteria bacterium]|nr:hemolysin III family protein [Candidatus Nomurabacteria bacterium]
MKKENEPLSSLSHFLGLALSIAGLVLLIVFAHVYAKAQHVVGVSIFGASLILLYLSSGIYHWIAVSSRHKNIWRKIDHAMIYVLIAGSYTPICLVVPQRAWAWSAFGVIWGLALLGVLLKIKWNTFPRILSTIIYLLMGWSLLIFYPILASVPKMGLLWLFLGGVFYSLGTIFYGLDKIVKRSRWWGMHEIFHLFVLAGSFAHWWFVFKYLLYV